MRGKEAVALIERWKPSRKMPFRRHCSERWKDRRWSSSIGRVALPKCPRKDVSELATSMRVFDLSRMNQ